MEEVKPVYSDPVYAEELNRTIIARGMRPSGGIHVKVESLKDEL